MAAASKTGNINLRISAEHDALVRRAADACGQSLTSFVMEAAVDRAQSCLLDQRFIHVSADVFDSVTETINQPAHVHPELVKLFRGAPGGRG